MNVRVFLALLLLALPCAPAHAGSVGLGAFGGLTFPILQDDTGRGALFGVRVPIRLVPLLTVEPYYASSSLADKVTTVTGVEYRRQGFDENQYGVNALLTSRGSVTFYPYAGVGRTSLVRAGFDRALTHFTVGAGAGFGVPSFPRLSIQVRGELQAAVEGHTTRKFGNATLGFSYGVFDLP